MFIEIGETEIALLRKLLLNSVMNGNRAVPTPVEITGEEYKTAAHILKELDKD